MSFTRKRPGAMAEKVLQATPEKRDRARELRQRMMPAERTLWTHLRDHRLDGLHFRRQQPKQGFIMDFYCHAARLVIEVDGPIHAQQAEYDAERDLWLTGDGGRILRVTNDDVRYRLAETLERIRVVCAEALSPAPLPRGEGS